VSGAKQTLRNHRGLVAAVLLLAVLPWVDPFSHQDLLGWLVLGAIVGGMAIAFDFTAGFIGIVNFGFAAFSGAGAYASALLAIHVGLSPWITMFAGVAIAAVLGFLAGVLTLRFRGIYAAIASWFLALALLGITRNITPVTGGPSGLTVPLLIDTDSNLPYYYIAVLLMLVTFIVLSLLVSTRMGLAFRAIGENVDAARASGINPVRYRVVNFTISCGFAGLMGAFYAHYYGVLTPDVMSTAQTVQVLVVAYLGGRGTLWGPALAAFPIVFGTQWLNTNLTQYPGLNLVIYGAILILVTIFFPGGLAELITIGQQKVARVRTGKHRLATPASSVEASGRPASLHDESDALALRPPPMMDDQ
jgi:branched-chain amino acid transport system permease protein